MMSWDGAAGIHDRVIIVTGATGGIGRAVSAALAQAGARMLLTGRDGAALDEVAAGLEGGPHATEAADLRDRDAPARLVARARDIGPDLLGLVHLAAVVRRRYDPDEVTEEDWDEQHDLNLKASFFLCREVGRALREQGRGGRIVTFASQAWWTGGFGGSLVYAASKGGVVSMTRGLARAYAPHRITVNCVSPGLVATPMLTEGTTPESLDAMQRQVPLGYVAEPGDMAGAVVFLLSDHARYVTGATINVSGGMLMY